MFEQLIKCAVVINFYCVVGSNLLLGHNIHDILRAYTITFYNGIHTCLQVALHEPNLLPTKVEGINQGNFHKNNAVGVLDCINKHLLYAVVEDLAVLLVQEFVAKHHVADFCAVKLAVYHKALTKQVFNFT